MAATMEAHCQGCGTSQVSVWSFKEHGLAGYHTAWHCANCGSHPA